MNIISELNRKYDRMEEPWRFLTAMVLIVPALTTLGIESLDPMIRAMSGGWILFIFYVRVTNLR